MSQVCARQVGVNHFAILEERRNDVPHWQQPVPVPAQAKITLADGQVTAKGPKGELSLRYHPRMTVTFDSAANRIDVTRSDDERLSRSLHGLTRNLIFNMVKGVTDGFSKTLEVVGVGYQASL